MMENPLLTPSPLPFEAPRFDAFRRGDYLPAFREAIARAEAEVDAIVADPEPPSFANTIEALEFAGTALEDVSGIFFNLLEAESNEALFARVKAVYDGRDALSLEPDQKKLLEETYKGFTRSGALLCAEDKKTYGKLEEELSLLELKYAKNVLDATNAFTLEVGDEAELEGLPHARADVARL